MPDHTQLNALLTAIRAGEKCPPADWSPDFGDLADYGLEESAGHLAFQHGVALLNHKLIEAELSDWSVQILEAIDSTNRVLMSDAHWTAPVLCTAETQLVGRGRRGRAWISPYARSISLSLGFKLGNPISELGGLSLLAGLALIEVLQQMGLQQAGLKWPNDLHVAGRKLSGILVEVRTPLSADASGAVDVVIGTGINVQLTEAEIAAVNQPVTSLAHCGLQAERSELIVRLAQTTRQFLDHFVASGFAPFVEAFNQVHVLHKQPCTIHLANGDALGKVQGISDTGNLLVEDSSGNLVQYAAGEVSLRPVNSPIR